MRVCHPKAMVLMKRSRIAEKGRHKHPRRALLYIADSSVFGFLSCICPSQHSPGRREDTTWALQQNPRRRCAHSKLALFTTSALKPVCVDSFAQNLAPSSLMNRASPEQAWYQQLDSTCTHARHQWDADPTLSRAIGRRPT